MHAYALRYRATGMRIGEALALEWTDLDLGHRTPLHRRRRPRDRRPAHVRPDRLLNPSLGPEADGRGSLAVDPKRTT